MLLRLRL